VKSFEKFSKRDTLRQVLDKYFYLTEQQIFVTTCARSNIEIHAGTDHYEFVHCNTVTRSIILLFYVDNPMQIPGLL